MSVVPSGDQFEIVAGDHNLTLVEVGGGRRSYTCGGRVVLDGYPADQMCTGGRGTPLIPWPTRRRLALRANLRANDAVPSEIADGTPRPREELRVDDPDGHCLMIAQRET